MRTKEIIDTIMIINDRWFTACDFFVRQNIDLPVEVGQNFVLENKELCEEFVALVKESDIQIQKLKIGV